MIELPKGYLDYINNGGILYGETNYEFGSYFDLEPIENIPEYNQDIEIQTYAPEFIAFGSDGGGEAFVFDANGAIYLLPFIGMESEQAVKVASSWSEFLSHVIPIT